MAKKTTLETLSVQMAKGFAKQGKEISDLTETVGFIVKNMATKDQVIALHTQVNSIERQLRETRTEIRLADLEEKVFGKVRA